MHLLRYSSDFTDNYYEYEIPLQKQPFPQHHGFKSDMDRRLI